MLVTCFELTHILVMSKYFQECSTEDLPVDRPMLPVDYCNKTEKQAVLSSSPVDRPEATGRPMASQGRPTASPGSTQPRNLPELTTPTVDRPDLPVDRP